MCFGTALAHYFDRPLRNHDNQPWGMKRSIDMNVKWIRGWLLLALEILVLLSAGYGVAGEANDQLKQSVDKVLTILNDPTLKGMGNSQERRQKVKEVVYS
jgi:ABC-type transporter MlaC component